MSGFTAISIEKPKWFSISPMKRGFGNRERYVIGFDSEAYHGRPILFQFAHPDGRVDLLPIAGQDPLDVFIEYLREATAERASKRQYVVVGWNLRYEYTQLFRRVDVATWHESQFVLHGHEIGRCGKEADDGWDIRLNVLNDKRYSFTVEFGKRRKIPVIDGMAFITGSLDNAAKVVGVDRKLKKPKGLGKVRPSVALQDSEFLAYARQDAMITQQVGQKIIDFHRRNDVPLSISAPQFAAYTFRHKYLDGEIPTCDPDLEEAGLASYHGGKNGLYLAKPSIFRDAYDYDINGAYTSAMAVLPDPVRAVWEEVSGYEPNVHALWYVRARTRSCKHRAFQRRDGSWYNWRDDGEQQFWITGYELDTALSLGELSIISCSGFVLRGSEGSGCIATFCDEMYHQKRSADTAEERQMAKLCLNSIYGKFIQKVERSGEKVWPLFEEDEGVYKRIIQTDPDSYRAGGLYHPAIASLITGNVRAQVHRLEHKYNAIMTSTDGFLSMTPPDPADIGPEAGKLKVRVGTLRIWRERLYHFQDKLACAVGCADHPDGGKRHVVYALHGFRGRIADLLRIPLKEGVYDYLATTMVGLRQSLTKLRGATFEPGSFGRLRYQLDLTHLGERSPLPP